MIYEAKNNNITQCRTGIVLLVTLVLLVVLSTMGYILTTRVSAQRHRDHYMIDYQKARYACDSAVKYALATFGETEVLLVSRPNEPDFSDLFSLSEAEYEELLADWATEMAARNADSFNGVNEANNLNIIDKSKDVGNTIYPKNVNDINDSNSVFGIGDVNDTNNPNDLIIRGPYGPTWPFIIEPVEFENAKYPVAWAMLEELGEEEIKREALASFETFCEWMDVNDVQIDELEVQLEEIKEIKPFSLELKPIKIARKAPTQRRPRSRRRSRNRSRRDRRKTTQTSKKASNTISVDAQLAEYAKLFHSSLIDSEILARPTIISESRKESALKYTGMWATRKVNINTAPRHVLEAAFVFGGDEVEIAGEIIERRRQKPFVDIADLKDALYRYTGSIRNCEKFITTKSSIFTIKVTATSGVAKASTVIAVTKNNKSTKAIGKLSG